MIVSIPGFNLVRIKWIILVLFLLIVAGSIYIFFRSPNTLINLILSNYIEVPYLNSKNYWLVYCLPGGLWLFSFQVSIILFVHQFKIGAIFLSLILALGIEGFQFLHITDGNFDWLDIYTYLFFSLLAFGLLVFNKTLSYSYWTKKNWSKYFIFGFFSGIVILSDLF